MSSNLLSKQQQLRALKAQRTSSKRAKSSPVPPSAPSPPATVAASAPAPTPASAADDDVLGDFFSSVADDEGGDKTFPTASAPTAPAPVEAIDVEAKPLKTLETEDEREEGKLDQARREARMARAIIKAVEGGGGGGALVGDEEVMEADDGVSPALDLAAIMKAKKRAEKKRRRELRELEEVD